MRMHNKLYDSRPGPIDFSLEMLYDPPMKDARYWNLYFDNLYRMIVPHYGERVRLDGRIVGTVAGGDEDGGLTVAVDGSSKYLITHWDANVELIG